MLPEDLIPADPPPPEKKKAVRAGIPVNVWVDTEINTSLTAYLASEEPQVSKTAAVESALRAFLQGKGFWPPPAEEG
jgi:hypothetical protein